MAVADNQKFSNAGNSGSNSKAIPVAPQGKVVPVTAASSPGAKGGARGTGSGAAERASLFARSAALNTRTSQVQQFPLFANLSLAECGDVASAAREWRVSPRQTIFQEGDVVRSVCVLTSGRVKITQLSRSGAEVIVSVQAAGEVVGAIGLLPGSKHLLTAQALEPCHLLGWDVRTFEAFEDRFPELRRNALRIVAKRLQLLEERFLELATEQVACRLAKMLVRLLDQTNHSANGSICIQLSREELAQMIGTTLFTVSRLLCDWEQRGIIQAQRKAVLIQSPRGLMDLAESTTTSLDL